MLPVMSGGRSRTGGRIITAVVVVALLALVVRDPVGAAATVERIWTFSGHVLDALTQFGNALSR
jgi:hypothetical protein